MPFGLKTVEAIYEKLMSQILLGQIGKTTKVYIDNMVVKSQKRVFHLEILKTFSNSWKVST